MVEDNLYMLTNEEVWWKVRYESFEERGYRLRPRYHPNWTPSWKKLPARERNKVRIEDCDDAWKQSRANIMDATRTSDGRIVYMKRVIKSSSEKHITEFLSSDYNKQDPRNHCVPLLDYFDDPFDSGYEIIVIPLLRRFDDPQFETVGEVVDFSRQVLEGIAFMHDHGIAHRDCSALNIMLDGTPMYFRGYHPIHQVLDVSGWDPAPYIPRRKTKGVKYYFIDFGISTHFAASNTNRLVFGEYCQDRTVPELSGTVPYDPFAVDVYLIGNALKIHVVNRYSNTQFFKPLMEAMTQQDPKARPHIYDALKQLEDIIAAQPEHHLRWESIDIGSGLATRILQGFRSARREGIRRVGNALASVSPSDLLETTR